MTVLEDLETAVVEIDATDRVLRVNGAAEQCLAMPRHRLEGCAFHELPGLDNDLQDACRDTREDGRDRHLHECPLAGGSYDCRVRLLRDGRMILEFHDLQWSRQQRQLRELQVQTGLLDLLRRNLGHEIRNPLGGIRGAAQLMAAELGDGESGQLAHMIMREVDRIDDLIKRFWQPRLRRDAFDIHQILEEALQLQETETAGALVVERDYDPSIPPLSGDASAIRRVLLNLLRNARQAHAGRLRVRTRIEHGSALLEKDRGLLVRVDLEDDGEGVPERLRPLLFLPMVTGRRDGTGLGLALAQQIAADHGGLMSYQALDRGSRFTLRLPCGEPGDE